MGITVNTIRAQDAGSKAGQLWSDSQAAFGKGDYATSAKALDTIVQGVPIIVPPTNGPIAPPAPASQQWLEPIYFMLGVDYFNQKDWPNAISTYTKYRQYFPKGQRFALATMTLGQANLLAGHPQDAIPLFTGLLPLPDYHEKALMLLVQANTVAGNLPAAISLLEGEKVLPNLGPDYLAKIDMKLFSAYVDAREAEKAVSVLQELDTNILHVQNVTEFNSLTVRLGDLFLATNKIDDAVNCYRRVRDNDQIIALQKQQIDLLQKQHEANITHIQADPLNSNQLILDNKDIDAQVGKDQGVLTQYQTLPPVLPPLFLRIGRAYSQGGELWEAAVVYRELMRRSPHCAEAEAALYGSIVVFDHLKQTDRAQDMCQAYLTQYPKGKYIDSVGYLRGALAYDAEDFDKASAYFEDSLKGQAPGLRREKTELILGDIELRQQKFPEAIASYKQYQTDYPQGAFLDPAEYRSALALLFGGKTTEADAALRAYLQKYPAGTYVADAEYRLAVVKFAGKEYDQTIADCQAWLQKHGDAGPKAEVLSLMGDCYASQDENDEAVKAYILSYKAAQTDEVLNYSIMAAAKLLQKQLKWEDIVTMFQEFIKDNPDHPTVVTAISWIGRAEVKLGKVEEGKQYLSETAKRYLNDPSREAVDEIITQLAQMYARRHLPVAQPVSEATNPTNVPTTSPSPAAPATLPAGNASTPAPVAVSSAPALSADPVNPDKELEDALVVPDLDSKPTARARILYAKAELARIQRKPAVEGQILLDIAKQFKPEDLSPILLGQAGDCLVQNNQAEQAQTFYHYLVDEYDKSNVVDYGYNGLGQIAYDQKDYAKAVKYFSKALDKGLASSKLKEITLGQAQALLALNRLDEAKPLFEQVASTRAWRGEATALSVFSLGEIQMGLGKFPEANAFYQRVFVAYQKYPAIQAKAYLKSGEAFEKMGKIPEAIGTYNEMLKNPNLSPFPENADAKQHLDNLASK